jgi:hypothetical protein
MSILNIQTAQPTGLASVNPQVIYIETTDTYAVVTGTGYLTQQAAHGYTFSNNQMALVKTSDEGVVWLKVVLTYSGALIENIVVSLVQISSPGDVVLPTIANHLMVSTDTVGTLANLTGTAINNGFIQSGLLAGGVVGGFIAYPTTTLSGFLEMLAVVNASGNFNTIISNASAIGQTQTVSIPDGGSATSNFIISKSASVQHITTGALQVDAGAISSGLATGGFVGIVRAYPTTTSTGFVAIQAAVNGSGDFGTTISNNTTQAQSQVMTIPDVGAATGQIISKTAPLVNGNFLQASGTEGLVIDSGIPVGAVAGALFAQVSISAAEFNGMYATPVQLVAAAGADTMIIVDSIALQMTYVSADYAAGGVVAAQYDNTANGAGVHASTDGTAADYFASASTVFKLNASDVLAPFSTCANKGIFLSNLTQAFTTGDSTFIVKVYYHTISTIA